MIVIPMVGKSSRFFQAGYTRPKYELMVGGRSVFAHAVASFQAYFDSEFFLFLVRADYEAEAFVRRELASLGVRRFELVVFGQETAGQADTVYQGLQRMQEQQQGGALTIFNIDTFRPGFAMPALECDGYLEVFEGEGEHWSFVRPGPGGKVLETTEKVRISNLCSDGLYQFRERALFDEAFRHAASNDLRVRAEFYIAPLYNYLIAAGRDIRYVTVGPGEIVFCGTPDEYLAAVKHGNTSHAN